MKTHKNRQKANTETTETLFLVSLLFSSAAHAAFDDDFTTLSTKKFFCVSDSEESVRGDKRMWRQMTT